MTTVDKETLSTLWLRNVKDDFKSLSNEQIKEILAGTKNPFSVAFEHWTGDFNMGTCFRNANAFNAIECFYIGPKAWDRRSAVGVHNYMDITNFKTFDSFYEHIKETYCLIGIDNVPGVSQSLEKFEWLDCKKLPLLIFGEEGCGLTEEAIRHCDVILEIEMHGSVRSFNCGTASGIAMYDLVTKCNYR